MLLTMYIVTKSDVVAEIVAVAEIFVLESEVVADCDAVAEVCCC